MFFILYVIATEINLPKNVIQSQILNNCVYLISSTRDDTSDVTRERIEKSEVPFHEISADTNPEARILLKEKYNLSTTPAVFFNGKLGNNFEDLERMMKVGNKELEDKGLTDKKLKDQSTKLDVKRPLKLE